MSRLGGLAPYQNSSPQLSKRSGFHLQQKHGFGAGFSLIDVLVGTALILILFVGLLVTLRVTTTLATASREKSAAAAVADTEIEHLRGLSYAAVASRDHTETLDGVDYAVHTVVAYHDLIAQDYKLVEVTVSYGGSSLALATSFSP